MNSQKTVAFEMDWMRRQMLRFHSHFYFTISLPSLFNSIRLVLFCCIQYLIKFFSSFFNYSSFNVKYYVYVLLSVPLKCITYFNVYIVSDINIIQFVFKIYVQNTVLLILFHWINEFSHSTFFAVLKWLNWP